ncbi:MAG: hydrogenase maturation nickel metallochaperone HypA [Opitutaceae bacterium]|nr:hydrogenase maturation nickel metallochaperone HypA [Opitutaceae bacterium]
MHEVSIIQGMLELAEKTAKGSGATRIHRLHLRVGAMSGVVPESLSFAFEVVREGTMAAEAELSIEFIPPVCWCPRCQEEFGSIKYVFECPKCHQFSRDLRKGRELELADMEVS